MAVAHFSDEANGGFLQGPVDYSASLSVDCKLLATPLQR